MKIIKIVNNLTVASTHGINIPMENTPSCGPIVMDSSVIVNCNIVPIFSTIKTKAEIKVISNHQYYSITDSVQLQRNYATNKGFGKMTSTFLMQINSQKMLDEFWKKQLWHLFVKSSKPEKKTHCKIMCVPKYVGTIYLHITFPVEWPRLEVAMPSASQRARVWKMVCRNLLRQRPTWS